MKPKFNEHIEHISKKIGKNISLFGYFLIGLVGVEINIKMNLEIENLIISFTTFICNGIRYNFSLT